MNTSSEPITLIETKKIMEQMTNGICKLKYKEKYGIGFLCKLDYINVLITNSNMIDDSYTKENCYINILLNNEEKIKALKLNKSRYIYYNEEQEIALIEIRESDYINTSNFLVFDDNVLTKDKPESYYQNKSIYVIQYLNMEKISVSHGVVVNIDDNIISHTCSIKSGVYGAPILNRINNKVIGISKEYNNNDEFNEGIFMKIPVIEFKNQIKEMERKKMEIPIKLNNKINFVEKEKEKKEEINQAYIVFKTTKASYGIVVNSDISIEKLLRMFLVKVKNINNNFDIRKSKTIFIFNSIKLNKNEKILKLSVNKVFHNRRMPTIITTHL